MYAGAITLFMLGGIFDFIAVSGDGNKTTIRHELPSGVSRLALESSLDAVVREGPVPGVTVTIDSNLQELVSLDVDGDTLRVRTRDRIHYRGVALVEVTFVEVRGASVRGSGDARVSTGPAPRDLELAVSGSGDLQFDGRARRLHADLHGSGSIELRGDADDLVAGLSGSGDVSYQGTARRVQVVAGGSGSIRLAGAADTVDAKVNGSGDLEARELRAHDASVSVHGSGSAEITLAGGDLRASVHGSGDVDWWGESRQVNSSSSGSGSVTRH